MIALSLLIAAVGVFPALAFNDTCYQPPYQGGGTEGRVASGDTPCSPHTDDNVARACCGYSDGSICLSNGLCFVPANNTMLQGTCTDPDWTSRGCPATKCVDSNLLICETTSGDVPAPGDGGGLWYCGTQTQSCAEATTTFGIQQGHFADFRNISTSSTAVTPTKSSATVSSAHVTNNVGSNAPGATETPPVLEPSCPPHTGGNNTLSSAAIAGIAIASFCAGLIVFWICNLISHRRRGGKHQVMQTAKVGKDITGTEIVGGPSTEGTIRELPANRFRGVELQ